MAMLNNQMVNEILYYYIVAERVKRFCILRLVEKLVLQICCKTMIIVSSPRKSDTLPLRAKKGGPSDVFDDVAALLDNKAGPVLTPKWRSNHVKWWVLHYKNHPFGSENVGYIPKKITIS